LFDVNAPDVLQHASRFNIEQHSYQRCDEVLYSEKIRRRFAKCSTEGQQRRYMRKQVEHGTSRRTPTSLGNGIPCAEQHFSGNVVEVFVESLEIDRDRFGQLLTLSEIQ
jgi:hypothetical protein